jgi:hypothetical protein
MIGTYKQINIKLALLLVAGVLALSLMVLSGSALGTITGDQPPASGDWVIDNPTTVRGEMITVYGNLTINDILTIDASTITMNLTEEGATKVNVTSTGNLKMTGSTITSDDTDLEYRFEVYGEMSVQRSDLEECYLGIRVITNKTVVIQDSNILESAGSGLYLKDADNTVIKNVNIHSDDFGLTKFYAFDIDVDRTYTYIDVNIALLHIDGGNPTIDGLDLSVNGTVLIESYTEKSVMYNYLYFNIYYVGVLIDSYDFTEVDGIAFHDSSLSVRGIHKVYNTYIGNEYMYIYTYTYYKGCVFAKFTELTLGGFDIDNVVGNYPSISTSYTGETMYLYAYSYYYAMELFYANVVNDFSTDGPHDLKIRIKDTEFSDTSILNFNVRPTYSGSGTPTFNVEMSLDNITVDGSSGTDLFYFYLYPQFATMKVFNVDINITNSKFTNVTSRILYEYIYRGTGAAGSLTFSLNENVRIENCEFRDCTGSSYLFYSYGYNYGEINNIRDRVWAFRNNTFVDNSVGSYMMYMYAGYDVSRGNEWLIFEDNVFRRTTASSYLMYCFGWERLLWKNNLFVDCVWYIGAYLNDYGGYANGVKPAKWWILNNTWQNCQSTYPYEYYGMLYLYGCWDLEVAGNNITECSSTFLSIYEYTYYASTKARVNFHDNNIWNNSGPVVYMYGYQTYHEDLILDIHDNTAWNCSGKLVSYYHTTYVDSYDYDATITFTNNDITNFTDVVFEAYGDITITDNTITDCFGYVFELNALNKHVPTITRNTINNCVNVYQISAKSKGAMKISITMTDLTVKCTGNAFKFVNVDMTLMNVTISDDVGLGIIAENSNVDLVDSLMPIGSGRIIGDGSINVWFNIEADVFWANSLGEETQVPVPEAMVIFTGSQGLYFTSAYTDENGHLRPRRVLNWNMDGPFMTLWSPYTVTIAKSGMSNTIILELDKNYVGENAVQIWLWDNSDPFIRLVSPLPDLLLSMENLTVMGFATELGSGINTLDISINDMQAEALEIDDNGDFVHTFFDVPQGDLIITARVKDMATNSNNTVLTVRIDRTPPTIKISNPTPGFITNMYTVQIQAKIEEGAVVVINEEEWGISPGDISVDFPLSEGVNTILIEATDEAGNVAFEMRTVFRDTIDPSLSLYAPRDLSLTRMTNVLVEGEAEEGSTVLISVLRDDVNLVDEVVVLDEDGMFSHSVDLSEGVNKIIVKAIDGAENEMELSRTVIVDTIAPECGIDEPVNGLITNEETVTVKGWAEIGDVLVYLNGKQIYSPGKIERIVRLHEGENTITLSVVDIIGNMDSHSVIVMMDSKAPVIEISTPVETLIMTNMPTVRVVGMVSGEPASMTANDVEVIIEDGVFDVNVPVDQNMVSDIILAAYDEAGNMGLYTLNVDHSTLAPMLAVEYSPHGKVIRTEDGNLYISGTTTNLVTAVEVIHESDSGSTSHTYSVRQAQFSMVLALEEGDNSVILKVTDIYGNTNSTVAYEAEYDPPKVTEGTDDGWNIQPQNLGLVLLVIAITVFVTAVIVTQSFKAKRE